MTKPNPAAIAAVLWIATFSVTDCSASNRANQAHDGATEAEIAALIADLSDASFSKRTQATSRLCAIGMAAKAQLLQAAAGADAEKALRAKHVIGLLDSIYFSGTQITLSFAKEAVRWDESLSLRVTMENTSPYPTKIPFMLDASARSKLSPNARLVGDIMDLTDWGLRVTDAQDRAVELVAEDIDLDPAVAKAVHDRLHGVASDTTLEPGESAILDIPTLNRGWARFPLLESGVYSVRFEYTPGWNDDTELAVQRVGRAVSNTADVTVTTSALPSISRTGQVAAIDLAQEADQIVARLINRRDVDITVNTNFGPTAPFASTRWVLLNMEQIHTIPGANHAHRSFAGFTEQRLIELSPGASLEVGRLSSAAIKDWLDEKGLARRESLWTLHFEYDNSADRRWQERSMKTLRQTEETPKVLLKPLPYTLLTTRQQSNAIHAADFQTDPASP